MAYNLVLDLTSAAKKAEQKDQPLATPFPAPDPALPEATPETLPAPLAEALRAIGWTTLMPVQAAAVPYLLDGRDLIVQSRTGSGKTGAFLLPMLQTLSAEEKAAQALVLCPTRELALQIFNEFQRLTATQQGPDALRAVAVYGGTAYGPQLQAFRAGAQLVIGTPGRVLDHLERGSLRLDRLRLLVLDEADEMLSMGFYPDMKQLRRYLPRERTGAMFSATMPYAVQRVGQEFLHKPSFLSLSGGTIHVDVMAHRMYVVEAMEKDRALVKLIEMENPASAIIFANTRREVEYLSVFLRNYGFDADGISSDLTQKAREAVMGRLRKGTLRFLVATDVAARGIDISDLSHVFQYDLPQDREYYIHRAGRTARAGKTGVSITLVTPPEQPALRDIIRRYDLPMESREVPTDAEVAARIGERLTVLLEDRLREKTNLDRERLRRFLPLVEQLVDEGEPELLAMLLDELYQRTLHTPAAAPATAIDEGDDEGVEADRAFAEDVPHNGDEAPPKKKRKKKKKKRATSEPGDAAPPAPATD
ncbi:MAG TPA: DEAD/DEAH box helicase [Rubricoccaceae bacterium]|nr:DEAD/DEAH box helicase [Rubricoccaceae bacterium]